MKITQNVSLDQFTLEPKNTFLLSWIFELKWLNCIAYPKADLWRENSNIFNQLASHLVIMPNETLGSFLKHCVCLVHYTLCDKVQNLKVFLVVNYAPNKTVSYSVKLTCSLLALLQSSTRLYIGLVNHTVVRKFASRMIYDFGETLLDAKWA
mgnify:CR=1 FL=1